MHFKIISWQIITESVRKLGCCNSFITCACKNLYKLVSVKCRNRFRIQHPKHSRHIHTVYAVLSHRPYIPRTFMVYWTKESAAHISYLIFVVPCIMLYSEINPTRCNNCVYSSQWLYSTCFG